MIDIILVCVLIVAIVAVVSLGYQVSELTKRKIEQRTDTLAEIRADELMRKKDGKYWKLIKTVSATDYYNTILVTYGGKEYKVKQANNIGLTLSWTNNCATEFLSWAQMEALNATWCTSWADIEGEKIQVNKTELEAVMEKAKYYDAAMQELEPVLTIKT